ncbi:coenzyme F420-0:L-glutamate ligase [Candidatus Giovannonibacteria bacterium]|nr:coenzyme F420-0:L-glutamate ligase [Candidatus Giovannonibacteria bacterium]
MKIAAIKTHKIRAGEEDLFSILDKYLKKVPEGSVLAVTSKIISLCEGGVVKIGAVDKDELIKSEADFFLPRSASKYDVMLAIKDGLIVPSSGIDESNADGYYVLWPKNPQESANKILKYLKKRFHLKKAGVIITDSKTTPLRWGTSGVAIAHSGFSALNDYIGRPDIFRRKLKMTKANIMDALAATAVLVMGEGREQTPIAIIENLPFVRFQNRVPSRAELKELRITIEDDLYSPLLKAVKWRKGKK